MGGEWQVTRGKWQIAQILILRRTTSSEEVI